MCVQVSHPADLAVSTDFEDAKWYAVYTYPRHEKAVATHLEERICEVFLPMYTTVSRRKDRHAHITCPLFPGYVFTRINVAKRVVVMSTPSVVRIVSFNGMPTPIPDSEIDAVRQCLAGGNVVPHPFLEVGERVRVRGGLFEGVEGIVIRHKNQCKLVVSLGLIGQSLALEISVEQLEKTSSRESMPLHSGSSRSAALQYAP